MSSLKSPENNALPPQIDNHFFYSANQDKKDNSKRHIVNIMPTCKVVYFSKV